MWLLRVGKELQNWLCFARAMEDIERLQACPETHGHQQRKTKVFEKKEFCTSPVKFEMPNVDTKIAIYYLNVRLNVKHRRKGINMKEMDIWALN